MTSKLIEMRETLLKGCGNECEFVERDGDDHYVWNCGDQFNTDFTPFCSVCKACLAQFDECIKSFGETVRTILQNSYYDDLPSHNFADELLAQLPKAEVRL